MGIAELEDSATPWLSRIVHLKEAKKHCCLQNICGAIPISQSFFSLPTEALTFSLEDNLTLF